MRAHQERIGFMQGRLSPMVNGRIQAFPWEHWKDEYPVAQSLDIGLMEWTLDQERLYENPLMTTAGQKEIMELGKKFGLKIPSLTGDCFMQAPFFKGENEAELLEDYQNIVRACGKLGIEFIIFPLVDNSSIKNPSEEKRLLRGLLDRTQLLEENDVKIVFESDFAPQELRSFISQFPVENFGINYDIGNSASLGFDPKQEIRSYGERILNIHVKDRVLGGTTVPLGMGNADFETVFSELRETNYRGNFILQTARSPQGEHREFVQRFTQLTLDKLQSWT